MIDHISIPQIVLLQLMEKYSDEDEGFRALAYFIHTQFANENGFNFRERINHLKCIKAKLDNAA